MPGPIFQKIYYNLFKNYKQMLNIPGQSTNMYIQQKSCSTSTISTLSTPIIMTLYVMLIKYLIKTQKIKKKQYKTLLYFVTAGIPMISFVLNYLVKGFFDTKSCTPSIISTGSITLIAIVVGFLIKFLVEKKKKKYLPIVVVSLVVLLFAGNLVWNLKYLGLNYLVDFNAKSWENKWDKPYRKFGGSRQRDPYDSMSHFAGSGEAEIENGIMKLTGHQPRLYLGVDWQNAEVECDYKRDGTSGAAYAGMIIAIRSHIEGHTPEHSHQTHTYHFACTNRGEVQFFKERQHGTPTPEDGDRVLLLNRATHTGHTDRQWHNYRFRCYNISDTRTKLQGYIDGELVAECIDQGDELMYNPRGCVFVRTTDVTDDGSSAQYRNFKAFEINTSEIEDDDHTGVEVILRKDQINKNDPDNEDYPYDV